MLTVCKPRSAPRAQNACQLPENILRHALSNHRTSLATIACAEKALITLSYIESDPQATAAHNRLKNSIVIR